MPSWVKVGRYRFDLDEVALVADGVSPDSRDSAPAVTITLRTGASFALIGQDVDVFLAAFDEHAAARTIERGPPRASGARLVVPSNSHPLPREADA